MNKKITVATLVVFILTSFFLLSGCDKQASDGKKFKKEYEALNGKIDEDDGSNYLKLSIEKENKVTYLEFDELTDFMENRSGILYFGRPACPWCRDLVPALIEFVKEKDSNIYYYNIETDREENNENYKKILSKLSEYLPTDTVTQKEDDPDFKSDQKRVVLPQLFFLKYGKVKADLLFYEHECLKNKDAVGVKNLLSEAYKTIEDCGC